MNNFHISEYPARLHKTENDAREYAYNSNQPAVVFKYRGKFYTATSYWFRTIKEAINS